MSRTAVASLAVTLTLISGCIVVAEGDVRSAATVTNGTSAATAIESIATDDPKTAAATQVSFAELGGRAAHTATMLASGEVLVVGGCVTDGCGVATAETFLVASDAATITRGPDLAGPRDGHTANVVSNGGVVLIAGYAGEGQPPLATVEVYEPASNRVRLLGELNQRRGGHASAVLPGNRVLVVGGWIARRTFTSSTELVDVSSGSIVAAAELPVALHAMDAVALSDGRVLITGGQIVDGEGTSDAWIYDAVADSWSETGAMNERRFKHFSVLMRDGRVLVIGGTTDDEQILATTEIYDPAAGTFEQGPDLVEPRYKLPGGAVLLEDDRIIVGGGGRSIEVIDLNAWTSVSVADLNVQSSFATTTALGDGQILVLGGYDRRIDLRRQARLISGT